MTNWKVGAMAGVVAGLVSAIVFSIMNYTAASALLSSQIRGEGTSSVEYLSLGGIAVGFLVGLCAGLVYARTRDELPGRSSTARALAMVSVFSLPWGLSWLLTLPLISSMVPSDYMQWIHSFGIEIQWLDVNTAPQQVTGLEGLFGAGAFFAMYIVAVAVWVLIFGTLLGYIWDKRTGSGRELGSK
nr:hypothetical protein [Candidatus Njordarchaeum guaymaensis]